MEKPDSASGCGCAAVYTLFSLTPASTPPGHDVSGSTPFLILKVKRKGYLYHLSDSMFVKSAFGVIKIGFYRLMPQLLKSIEESDMAIRLANANDATLPQDRDDCCAKQNSASQQFGFSNSTKKNSEGKWCLVVGFVKDASDSGNVLKENSFQNDRCGKPLRLMKPLENKDVSHNDREYKSKENTLQIGPASKKKRKAGRKDGNGFSLIEHGEKATGSDTAISECTYGQKLENTSSVFDHLNTESVETNPLSTADASGGRRREKAKIESWSNCERQHVSETNKVAPLGITRIEAKNNSLLILIMILAGDNDMDEANDGNSESKKNEPSQPGVVASVIKTRDSSDQNSSYVDGHSTPCSREGINFQKAFGVSDDENQSGTLEEKIVEPKKSSRKVKKSKKNKGPVGGTEAVDAVHNSIPANGISPAHCPIVTGEHLCDNAEQAGKTDGKDESEMEKPDCSPSVSDVKADDVIQDVLESLKRCDNASENAENTGKKSRKKTKNKSSTVMVPPELQGKDYVDHRDPTFLVHNVTELIASSKSTSKTVNGESVQLNGTNLGSNQITLERKHDGRSIQDVFSVDHTKSTRVENSNNKKEVTRRNEMVKSQQHRETVDSGSKTPAAKASSNQSQRSSSKVEPSSSNVKSSKPLLTIPEIVAKEPPQSKKSEKVDSTLNNAQRPIDVNSSRVHTDLKKNNPRAVSSSAIETPKKIINSKKGGSELQSRLDIAKANGTNSRKVENSLANKKSLLATTVTIFRHDDKESSDDEDGVGNSDSSTRTPSDSSSSSYYSNNSIAKGSSSQNGSCNSKGEEAGGRKKEKPVSSSPRSMSLHAILRNSSSYKKAKLTASQDIDSQPEEFVPDSQPAT
ncbi:3-ketoacyl-CoA reductase 1 isoform 1 [Hibiscus syriacus]|uniref:3-ketoacyl-CoA reductase 1 isoform 1 n=1 Tax=Hibiscus syriacus TaxID=106335 RepID=A0A6A2XQ48_HIBSY|nr:3-ketoacyl-CoA reductase 1 isoform 1 [Hibiscus syriacus]